MKYLLILTLFCLNKAWAFNCNAQYDSLGIPHQETSSMEEFYYCFGFHHGQDRAWEMDFLRRVAQGRNSEVLGYSHMKSDLMMRLLNLPGKAVKLWADFPEQGKKFFGLYADGVNAGFLNGRKAQEFIDAGYVPEPWRPEDSITLLLTQSFDQTRKTFYREYLEDKAIEAWGDKAPVLFSPEGIPWENNILKPGEYPKNENLKKRSSEYSREPIKLWASFPMPFGENSGSNNWVISAAKSKTGKAILANDPHLDLKTPMFWYWIHLKSPQTEMIGASLPGVPVVAAGTNGKVAWGLTNSYINTADAVFLKDPWPELFESIRPVVWIKFWFFKVPFFFKSFERLKTGQPVLPLETNKTGKMVLKWTGFSLTPQDILPMFDFMNAKNVSEMDEVLKRVGVPAWNFVFADTKGNIGFRMVGKSYRHTEKYPFGIPVQSIDTFLKENFLTPEERPALLNPRRNYIYSANNQHWPTDAAFYGGRGYSHSFRGVRIEEMLADKHDAETFKMIQCDQQVVDARYFVPRILKYIKDPLLLNWNQVATDSSLALPLYRRFIDITMEEWALDEYALYRTLDKLTQKQQSEFHVFYDRAVKDVNGRHWGEFHRLSFDHLSNDKLWSSFSPDIPGVGDTHSVNPGTSKWNKDRNLYQQYSGASMRMIIEMSEHPKIQLVMPGLNREYTVKGNKTPWQDWKECRYSEVAY
ncbi:MAG TPA: penicillin acylase family protein [Bacteriovoracaceae bacterium]|nr:penicillin acylase family protein [Bacteriovoracaceae bacterium]